MPLTCHASYLQNHAQKNLIVKFTIIDTDRSGGGGTDHVFSNEDHNSDSLGAFHFINF